MASHLVSQFDRHALAHSIKKQKEKILKNWEDTARSELTAAEMQSKTRLRDSLPKFIDHLIETLSCDDPSCLAEVSTEVAKEHAQDRYELEEYSLAEMLAEYSLLRQVFTEFVETDANFDLESKQILYDFLGRGVRKATLEYVKLESQKKIAAWDESQKLTKELDITIQNLQLEKQLRERFISALTHDLRTPLTSAKMGAQLIMRKPESLTMVESTAKRIVGSMNRADQMIRDLLDANLIKAGDSFPVSIEEINLYDLVSTTINDLVPIYGPRFIVKNTDREINGFWDRQGIQRVIENLASNAVKYGNHETPVTVFLSEKNSEVEIAIHNDGKPIAEKDFTLIFDQFGRTSHAQNGIQIGWGVGLTLVKGISEALGGSVRVESSVTTGTTFFVKLPKDARK